MRSPHTFVAKTAAKGFTLIELIIVMAIVSILTAIAMPMYQEYSVKVRMADMQRYALLLTMDQDKFYEENGRFYGWDTSEKAQVVIGSADSRGFDKYHYWTTVGKSSSKVLIVMHITEDLYPDAVAGKKFIYEGTADSFGRITWECVQHKNTNLRMDAEYVPDGCTDIFTILN